MKASHFFTLFTLLYSSAQVLATNWECDCETNGVVFEDLSSQCCLAANNGVSGGAGCFLTEDERVVSLRAVSTTAKAMAAPQCRVKRKLVICHGKVGLHAVPSTGTAVVSTGPERERSVDPSTRRRPFLTGTAVKNAAKEPTERDGMPVAGPRRTGATGTACSPKVLAKSSRHARFNIAGL
ncbi:hypothetical protein B0H16DRAFT_1470546 [Mycena metata]|uniref:Uncharacterized protein n=1 Tax=Mycena metata TaxID=1033252 RepID=A0AAD7HVY4_9AGAR|nr:hypothetical protein B0H16DRAFT_1470546 [Mycena metata]